MNNYFINIEKFIINKYINNYPNELKDKVLYLLQNGKRLRPILFLIFSDSSDSSDNSESSNSSDSSGNTYENDTIYNIAIYIEVIHSLSLVLDDLPEMDNDSLRRDNLTFHVKYGIDYTNFFIYYMFNHIGLDLDTSINIFLENKYENLVLINNIINDIKKTINKNINLLIDGQYNDLEWNKKESIEIDTNNTIEFLKEKDIILDLLDIDNNIIDILGTLEKVNEIELNIDLNMKKTSSLFNLSITIGFILQLWKKNINYVNDNKYIIIYDLLSVFSNILGYMFQISDDLLDIENDIKNNKPNICSILDKDIVRKLLKNGCKWLYENANKIYQQMLQDLETPARKEVFRKNFTKKHEEDIEYDIENNIKYDINYDIEYETKTNNNIIINKKITFDIKSINEIIKKIENRIE